MLAEATVEGLSLTTVSYHAPPGVTWEIVKPRQAVTIARWLSAQQGPVLLGADANTRTGKRKNSPGTGRRYDCIWLTAHWTVQHIDHLYDERIDACSDHALVLADLAAG